MYAPFLKQMDEPAWFTELRLQALANAEELPLPKPDKTKIDKWNFTQFPNHVSMKVIHLLH